MTIPRTLTAEEFKGAPVEDQALYAPTDDGNYSFIGENAGELRRAKLRASGDADKIAKERDALKLKIAEYEKAQLEAEHAEKVKSNDVKEVDAAWKTKHEKEIQAREEKINALTQRILRQERDATIDKIATDIALPENVHLVKLMLKDRIDFTIDANGQTQPVVLDEEKKVTRDSIKDLTKEITKDKRNAHILKGVDDYGSGATKSPTESLQVKPAEGSKLSRDIEKIASDHEKFMQMTPAEKLKFITKGGY